MSSDFYTVSILPHAGIIIRICRAYTDTQQDFEDHYQEVCLQVWRSRERFEGKSSMATWIYRISLNVCMTMLKQRQREPQHGAAEIPAEGIAEVSRRFADSDLDELYGAIHRLSEVDRAVIMLHLDGLSHKEIAGIIGTNQNNIGVRISRIKERLKKLLDGKIN